MEASRFTKIQKELIESCERVHYEGIRHTGLSGSVLEDLLIGRLREAFPDLKFNTGIIKFCDPFLKGNQIKKDNLSPQMDIIIYNGDPIYKNEWKVLVHIDQVLGIIEVKKWTNPEMLEMNGSTEKKTVFRKIQETKKLLKVKSKREIPIFYVTYRFFDGNHDWFTKLENLEKNKGIKFYCFFGKYNRRNGINLYPWEEASWNVFENENPYRNQFKKLVEDIQNLKF